MSRQGVDPPPPPPVRASRARRTARRRRLRVGGITLLLIALVAAGAWWTLGRATAPGAAGPPSSGPDLGSRTTPLLLSLDVIDGSAPYLAVMGTDASGSRPAAIPIPHDLTLVVPGQGETPAADVAGLPGASMQVALSNELGAWTQNYVVMTVAQLGAVASRMGGLPVTLPSAVTTSGGVLGPGNVTLGGRELQALLNAKGGDPDD
ncbi:MAG: hypothetical protein L3K06_08310, partial [Thermoplasmata archaeon]|nr:hypothetical protein [Thermoplasmata archaeon]